MKIETSLHADHQLDQLAGQLEHWRQSRPHSRKRIPQEFWDQAVALTTVLSPSRVAKHLRLSWTTLKKQMAVHQESAAALPTTLGFVEVPPSPSSQATPATEVVYISVRSSGREKPWASACACILTFSPISDKMRTEVSS